MTMKNKLFGMIAILAVIVFSACNEEAIIGTSPITFALCSNIITINDGNAATGIRVTASGTASGEIQVDGLPENINADINGNIIIFTGTRPKPREAAITASGIILNITRQDITKTLTLNVNLQPFPYITTGVSGLEMSWIPPGTFMMGSPTDEPGHFPEERQHQVTLTSGFWMMRTTVTRGQWRTLKGMDTVLEWENEPNDHDNLPATHVVWYDAIVFANRMSIKAGLTPVYEMETTTAGVWCTNPDNWGNVPTWAGDPNLARWDAVRKLDGATGYRLPTEAQWEYACRAGTTTAFNDGITNNHNDTAAIAKLGWFFGHPLGDSLREGGQRQPNAWDLYDMHGNVWEWVWDWAGAYPDGHAIDPTGPNSGEVRRMRGGAWASPASSLRSARRFTQEPYSWESFFGFRLVRPF